MTKLTILLSTLQFMIISKTPYRISFFGGGSDYPEWFNNPGYYGEVISTTINKYIYLSIRELPPFFGIKYRFSYSKIEETNNIKKIQHKALRGLINFYKPKQGLEIHYDGDLPSKSGMGSSSSFTVGAINSYLNFNGLKLNKNELARKSIDFEHKVLKETVGVQDQIAASFGGFNIIKINNNGFKIKNLNHNKKFLKKLNDNLFLIYTGQSRYAHKIANSFVKNLSYSKKENIEKILNHVEQAKKIIHSGSTDDFGSLLNDTWQEKKKLSKIISNSGIDHIYDLAMKNGSLGGKLLGAGSGGFLLFYVPLNKQENFKKKFKNYIKIPFKFSTEGSSIIYKD